MSSSIEKAARALAAAAANGMYNDEHINAIVAAVKTCDEDPNEKKAALRSLAVEQYKSDEIEIDDDAIVSEGDTGAFVQAWVWVEKEVGDES